VLKNLKRRVIAAAESSGLLDVALNSAWRQRRLLILCYHGISLDDEDAWDNKLYMSRQDFVERMEILKRGDYQVLGLSEGLERLSRKELPPRSVAITFDDGGVDFYRQAFPVLKSYGYSATVYLTTFYSDFNHPVFRLICSYMLWKRRGAILHFPELSPHPLPLGTLRDRIRALDLLDRFAHDRRLPASGKNALAGQLAQRLGLDFEALHQKRILHLMNPSEVREIADHGIDVQLHTHRHRVPPAREAFEAEVRQNSARIFSWTGSSPVHFCYPGGTRHPRFLPWMRELGITSGVTCEPGLASPGHDPLLLPRLIDTTSLSASEFESWLTGAGAFLPRRPRFTLSPHAT
jgi:peptidoglycan/xylan/chitin deacetylase (PgdA/CDA1 family)